MPTQRQKKLAKAIVENMKSNNTKTAGQLLESIGYSKNTAEGIPGEIINSKGVVEELANLGISIEAADKVVGSILKKGRDEHKLKAADLTYKRLGGYAPEKHEHKIEVDPETKAGIEKALDDVI